MQPSEAAAVLTAAAIVDRRTIGETDARMWADILPEWVTRDVAIEAVKRHYRKSREWVMPADVIERSREIRADIVRELDMPEVPEVLDGAGRYEWRHRWITAALETHDRDAATRAADAALDVPALRAEYERASLA